MVMDVVCLMENNRVVEQVTPHVDSGAWTPLIFGWEVGKWRGVQKFVLKRTFLARIKYMQCPQIQETCIDLSNMETCIDSSNIVCSHICNDDDQFAVFRFTSKL